MLGGPVRSAGSDRVRGFPRILLEKFVVGRAVRFPPRPAAWTGVERLISECGEETVVSECGARCFSGGQARKTCPPEYRRPGGGRPSRLDFFSPGRLPFPSTVMGMGGVVFAAWEAAAGPVSVPFGGRSCRTAFYYAP